jgi:hypothetical protein
MLLLRRVGVMTMTTRRRILTGEIIIIEVAVVKLLIVDITMMECHNQFILTNE